jgi:hypothetical protein
MNTPTMEELVSLLREQGATNIKRNGQIMTIESVEVITITMGSARIENVVLGLIGGAMEYQE